MSFTTEIWISCIVVQKIVPRSHLEPTPCHFKFKVALATYGLTKRLNMSLNVQFIV